MTDFDKGLSATARKLDPEPATIALAALGAAGSMASIWAVLRDIRAERVGAQKKRRKRIKKLRRRLRRLRQVCREMNARLDLAYRMLAQAELVESASLATDSRMPSLFGAMRPVFDREGFQSFWKNEMELHSLASEAVDSTYAAISLIEKLGVVVRSSGDRDAYFRLLGRLNRVSSELSGRQMRLDVLELIADVLIATEDSLVELEREVQRFARS